MNARTLLNGLAMGGMILAAAVIGPVARAAAKPGLSPVGQWEITWKGYGGSKGIMYAKIVSDQTMNGYVLDTYYEEFFEFTGVWQIDAAGQVSGTLQINGEANPFTAFVAKAGKISGVVTTSEPAPVVFQGKAAGSLPNVAGTWRGTVKSGRETFPIELDVTPMPGLPGAYFMQGLAHSGNPPEVLDGGLVVTSKGAVFAGASADNGEPGEAMELFMSGKLSPTKGITLRGETSNPDDPPFSVQISRQ